MISGLEIRVEEKPAREYLQVVKNQVPFALALALNRTAEEAIHRQQEEMPDRFTIRTPWVAKQFFLNQRADKAKPEAVLAVGKDAGFLLRFQKGGRVTMAPDRFGVTRPFAVPTKMLRPSRDQVIDPKLYPINLGFIQRRHLGNDGKMTTVFAGSLPKSRRKVVRAHYFMMRPRGQSMDEPGAGIWIRIGTGKGQRRGSDRIRRMWKFRSSVPIPATLLFVETTNEVIAERFEINFDGMMAHAIRTAVRITPSTR